MSGGQGCSRFSRKVNEGKENVQMKNSIVVLAVAVTAALAAQTVPTWDLAWLEHIFSGGELICGSDESYVPHRNRDALSSLGQFMTQGGWTTNQLVEALIFEMTNNMSEVNWADETKRRVARRAASRLGEINLPAVTNFFREFNDSDDTPRLKMQTIPGMIWYTNLEPEVLDYMRTLCVRTNVYDEVALTTARIMYETLETMPPELKPAATNRVAKYMYFALHHATHGFIWPDRMLAGFIPSYSNSIQRLDVSRHITETTTDSLLRAYVQHEVDRLSAIPTNQLNDISWIAEE